MRHRFFLQLNRAQRGLKTRLERETREGLGLSSLELGALWALQAEPGLGVQELARALYVDHAVVSRLSKQLLRKGVVQASADPQDGRRTCFVVTESGAAKARAGQVLLKAANARITEGFSAEELDVVARFLASLIEVGAESGRLAGEGRDD